MCSLHALRGPASAALEPDHRKSPRISRRGFIVAGAVLSAGIAIGARTWWVNAHAIGQPQTIRHAMGEWVALNGAFSYNLYIEQSQGYSVRISAAELLSYNDYIEKYAVDGSQPIPGLDEKSIVCLTMGMRNDGSDGGLNLATMYLIPQRKNEFFLADTTLLASAEKGMRGSSDAPSAGIQIRSGTEYEIHLGYTHQGGIVSYNGQDVDEAYLNPIADTKMELVLTNLPVRHTVEIELPG